MVDDDNRFVYSLVAQRQLTEKLRYVLHSDLGVLEGVGAAPDSEWYGINQYLLYTINDCWKMGGRFEWFRDDDGTRVTVGGETIESDVVVEFLTVIAHHDHDGVHQLAAAVQRLEDAAFLSIESRIEKTLLDLAARFGEQVDRGTFSETNARMEEEGKQPSTAEPQLLGMASGVFEGGGGDVDPEERHVGLGDRGAAEAQAAAAAGVTFLPWWQLALILLAFVLLFWITTRHQERLFGWIDQQVRRRLS